MNSLMNYGSDDECDVSSEENPTESRAGKADADPKAARGGTPPPRRSSSARQADVDYEEVHMDLSEESDDSGANRADPSRARRSPKERDVATKRHDNKSGRRDRDNGRHRDRRDRDRRSRRSDSRDRRRGDRERSRSRDRTGRRYAKRHERPANAPEPKYTQQDSTVRQSDARPPPGAETQPFNNKTAEMTAANKETASFFMPGISGRFREQIERRKLLWQKKEPEDTRIVPNNKKYQPPQVTSSSTSNNRTGKVWEATTFAQDTDGKVASKFKRLMGIKKGSSDGNDPAVDVLKKQEEMFSSMEQQYEVARTATHTMRGVGLGFGSYQR